MDKLLDGGKKNLLIEKELKVNYLGEVIQVKLFGVIY